jgi:hypothetical protein
MTDYPKLEIEALDMLMKAINIMNDSYVNKETGKPTIPVSDREFRERITMIHGTIQKMQWKIDNQGLCYRDYVSKLKEKRSINRNM